MTPRFYHIGVNFSEFSASPQRIDERLNFEADDWIRYSLNCWIIVTSKDANRIFEALKSQISLSDSIFVVRIDPSDRSGFLPAWAWDWIDTKLKSLATTENGRRGLAEALLSRNPPSGTSPIGGLFGTLGNLGQNKKSDL